MKVPKADVFDVNFADGTFKDNSPFGTKGDVKGNVTIEYDKALKKNVMKLNGKANTFGYLPFSAKTKEKIVNTFTLETVFSMNEIADKVFCKIQRAAELDLSLQEVDMLNYGLTLEVAINVLVFN